MSTLGIAVFALEGSAEKSVEGAPVAARRAKAFKRIKLDALSNVHSEVVMIGKSLPTHIEEKVFSPGCR